jgi:UTP--glucose-1-phosphate uridylyltransferase
VRVRKAVIPAAGLGTRFLPATKAIPKEMLPIVDVPVIQLIVEEAVQSGIEQIVIVTSGAKRAIEDHFDYAYELESRLAQAGKQADVDSIRAIAESARFTFVRQGQPLGNGHAVLCAREVVGDEPFAVLWGDDLARAEIPVCRQLIDVYERQHGSVLAVMPIEGDDISRYGVIAGERIAERTHRVTDLVEKPPPGQAPSNLAAVKEYILTPAIFDILAETPRGQGGEIWLADAIRELARREPVFAYEFIGERYDPGNRLGYLKATVEYALARDDVGPQFRRYLRGLDLGTRDEGRKTKDE